MRAHIYDALMRFTQPLRRQEMLDWYRWMRERADMLANSAKLKDVRGRIGEINRYIGP
jgi:hypothetical protein